MSENRYDLVVIGSGPAGHRGAIAAAKLGKRVLLVDRDRVVGGESVHTGAVPTRCLREAVMYFSSLRNQSLLGATLSLDGPLPVRDLARKVDAVVRRESAIVRDQLERNGVRILAGTARFVSERTVEVETADGTDRVSADFFLIACGARAARDLSIPLDGKRVFDADQIGELESLPEELIVVGGGVIGLEFASMMAALRRRVTVLEQGPALLDFVDQEVLEVLLGSMRDGGVTFHLNEAVVEVVTGADDRVEARARSGARFAGDALLFATGRTGNAHGLRLEAADLAADGAGRIKVDEYFQTEVDHIYAAGDVIGFPNLASTSQEQGRLAVHDMFSGPRSQYPPVLPHGIYTVPEISMVGRTEDELRAEKIPYLSGIARFDELARAQMMESTQGLLKLLFDPDDLTLLGVHVIGDSAAELIHIGQSVIAHRGSIEYFRDAVFNYPTLSEAYKVAAFNGLNKR